MYKTCVVLVLRYRVTKWVNVWAFKCVLKYERVLCVCGNVVMCVAISMYNLQKDGSQVNPGVINTKTDVSMHIV